VSGGSRLGAPLATAICGTSRPAASAGALDSRSSFLCAFAPLRSCLPQLDCLLLIQRKGAETQRVSSVSGIGFKKSQPHESKKEEAGRAAPCLGFACRRITPWRPAGNIGSAARLTRPLDRSRTGASRAASSGGGVLSQVLSSVADARRVCRDCSLPAVPANRLHTTNQVVEFFQY